MFELLDDTLKIILDDPQVGTTFPELFNADVSFVTPEKGYISAQETVNLFFYEAKENRELRDPEPILDQRNGMSVHRRPQLRVDCTYLVTAWSKQTGAAKVTAEHQLLGQALNWLSRFPEIPESYLTAGGLANQVFSPPTLVAQMDPVKNAGEFWAALGIAPRPFFNVIVTIAMDLDKSFDAPIVTTISAAVGEEELTLVGGTVRDSGSNPVADAWVRLEPAGLTQVTDDTGHFIFTNVKRGSGMTLRARARDLGETTRSPVEIPSLTRDYDLNFS